MIQAYHFISVLLSTTTTWKLRPTTCPLPIFLLHLGLTRTTLDGKELSIDVRADRADLGDHIPDTLGGLQGSLFAYRSVKDQRDPRDQGHCSGTHARTAHIGLYMTGVEGETSEPFVRELDRVDRDDHVQARLPVAQGIHVNLLSSTTRWYPLRWHAHTLEIA